MIFVKKAGEKEVKQNKNTEEFKFERKRKKWKENIWNYMYMMLIG